MWAKNIINMFCSDYRPIVASLKEAITVKLWSINSLKLNLVFASTNQPLKAVLLFGPPFLWQTRESRVRVLPVLTEIGHWPLFTAGVNFLAFFTWHTNYFLRTSGKHTNLVKTRFNSPHLRRLYLERLRRKGKWSIVGQDFLYKATPTVFVWLEINFKDALYLFYGTRVLMKELIPKELSWDTGNI